jgi:two-component system LytT family response regulator
MRSMENALDPLQFARIHRSTIVNLDRIREFRSGAKGDYVAVMRDGIRLKLSRTYRDGLEARLGRPL